MYLAVCTFAVMSFHVLHRLPWAAFLAQCWCRPISLRRQRSLGLFFTCSYARSGCLVTSRLCLSSVARDCIPRATSTAKRRTSHCTALPACRRRTPCSETRVVANDACFMIVLLVFACSGAPTETLVISEALHEPEATPKRRLFGLI